MLKWSAPQWGVLLVLVLVVALSWWLGGESALQMTSSSAQLPGGFEARGIKIAQYHADGAVKYLLQAERMQQYGKGNPTDLKSPVLEDYGLKGEITHFDAPLAQWFEETDVLKFPQDLRVSRPANEDYLALNFMASEVSLSNQQKQLVGKAKVNVQYGHSRLQAEGVYYDWAKRQLVLQSKVRMVYAKQK